MVVGGDNDGIIMVRASMGEGIRARNRVIEQYVWGMWGEVVEDTSQRIDG